MLCRLSIYILQKEGIQMMTLTMILGLFVGYEGYDNGKLYIGTYTPTCEYGWVITDGEIYLDTIYEKNNILPLDN